MPIAINLHPTRKSDLSHQLNRTLRVARRLRPHSTRLIVFIHVTAIALAVLGALLGSVSHAATQDPSAEVSSWSGVYLSSHGILNDNDDNLSAPSVTSVSAPPVGVRGLVDRIEIQKIAAHRFKIHLKSYQSIDQSCEFDGVATDSPNQEFTNNWPDSLKSEVDASTNTSTSRSASAQTSTLFVNDGTNQVDRCELRLQRLPSRDSQIGRANSIRVIANDNCQSYCGAQATPEIESASRSASATLDSLMQDGPLEK